jgi:hypothetical protein
MKSDEDAAELTSAALERIAALENRVEKIFEWMKERITWLEEHSKSCVCVFVDGQPVEECGYHMELRREINRLRAGSTGNT